MAVNGFSLLEHSDEKNIHWISTGMLCYWERLLSPVVIIVQNMESSS